MKYRDAAAGAVVLAIRLLWIPFREVPTDWIAVVAIFWIIRSLTPDHSRGRDYILAAAGFWLTALYAWTQGPFTLAVLPRF